MKTLELEKVVLKNVVMNDGTLKDIEIELVPFSYRNDSHVDFAFAYADMLGRIPSPFSSVSDAAVRAVELFMVHKEEEAKDPNSLYSAVHKDKRAARTVLGTASLQKALGDFFENA